MNIPGRAAHAAAPIRIAPSLAKHLEASRDIMIYRINEENNSYILLSHPSTCMVHSRYGTMPELSINAQELCKEW